MCRDTHVLVTVLNWERIAVWHLETSCGWAEIRDSREGLGDGHLLVLNMCPKSDMEAPPGAVPLHAGYVLQLLLFLPRPVSGGSFQTFCRHLGHRVSLFKIFPIECMSGIGPGICGPKWALLILMCVTHWLALVTQGTVTVWDAGSLLMLHFCFLHIPSESGMFRLTSDFSLFYTFISIIFLPHHLSSEFHVSPTSYPIYILEKITASEQADESQVGKNVLALFPPLNLLICLEALAVEPRLSF